MNWRVAGFSPADQNLLPLRFALLTRRIEILTALLLFGGLIALHGVYAFTFRFDSDEPQHLHVVWGWTQGQLPYRDFFDNHSPLFAWLCAPVLHALGESLDVLPWMRVAMLPCVGLCLVGVYQLGVCLFDRRVGLWAAVTTGFWPTFFYTTGEFRPDTLWTAFWLLTLATLLKGRVTHWRLFFFGLTLGFSFATSMKTALLAAALLLAGSLVAAVLWRRATKVPFATLRRHLSALVVGLTLVPGAFAVFFIAQGAWKPLFYCLISHNTLAGLAGDQGWVRWRPLLFPLCLPGLFVYAHTSLGRPGNGADPRNIRRVIFLLVACGYPLLLVSFWPLLTPQDYLPATPPLILLAVAGLFAAYHRPALFRIAPNSPAGGRPWPTAAFIALPILGELLAIFYIHGPWQNRTVRQRELLATILRLTSPADFVMDDKGETIFRQRPFYFALEGITRWRLQQGLIVDDIAERLIVTRTAVVHARFLPDHAREFVASNYLPIGRLSLQEGTVQPVEHGRFSVLGKLGEPSKAASADPTHRFYFQVEVPASYVVIDAVGGLASGQLDGQRQGHEGRWLPPGRHDFSTEATGSLILFWTNAWEKGFRPTTVSDSLAASHGQITRSLPGRPPPDSGTTSR